MNKKAKTLILICCLLLILPSILFARCNEWVEFFEKRRIFSYAIQDNIHWIGTGLGLLKYNSENNKIELFYEINDIDVENVHDIATSNNGEVWFLINRSSILNFDGKNWKHFSSKTKGFTESAIHHIATDELDNLWVIFNHNIMKFDGVQWHSYPNIYVNYQNIDDLIIINDVIWLLSSKGLDAFYKGKWFEYDFNRPYEYSTRNKRFVEDKNNNSLLIYFEGVIYKVSLDSSITINPLEIEDNLWRTTSFKVDDIGALWIAQQSGDGGDSANFYKVENKKLLLVESISIDYDDYDYITQIEEDNQGNLWLITTEYLYKISEKTIKHINLWNVDIPFNELDASGQYKNIYGNGKGNLIDNQEEGHWVYKNENNQITMEGDFITGKKIGLWKMYFDNGSIKKIIEYKNGFKDGYYLEHYKNGNKRNEASYSHGKLAGKWIFWYENGIMGMSAEYENNLKNGIWLKQDSEGRFQEKGEYKNNIKDGVWFEYFENGCQGEIEYEKGIIIGEWNYWNSEEVPIYSLKYTEIIKQPNKLNKHGNKQGSWITFMDRRFKPLDSIEEAFYYRIAEYNDGIPQGNIRDYFMNGTLQFEGRMISEFPSVYADGKIKIYDNKGNLKIEREYINGTKNGIEQTWGNDVLLSMGNYKNSLKEGHWVEIIRSTSIVKNIVERRREVETLINSKHEGKYVKGKREGIWKVYAKEKQVRIRYYEKGTYLKPVNLQKINPSNFLQILKSSDMKPVLVFPISSSNWKLKQFLKLLINKIESQKESAPILSSESLMWPEGKTSTVGREAMYMLQGFIDGIYPPTECSVIDFNPKVKYYKKWWQKYQNDLRKE